MRAVNGQVRIDATGRLDGRGAYICLNCGDAEFTGLAFKISRALRLESAVTDEFLGELGECLTGNRAGN